MRKIPVPPDPSKLFQHDPADTETRHQLREWWHEILRLPRNYSCYAFLLALPSDKAAIKYLKKYSDELHQISGKDCLVIVLQEDHFGGFGANTPHTYNSFPTSKQVQQHISFSTIIANYLGIDLPKLPCLVLFRDIREPDYKVIDLRNLTTTGISKQLREVFSVIQHAASQKIDPLEAIEDMVEDKTAKARKQAVVSEVRQLSRSTFQVAVDTLIKTLISRVS